MSGKTSRRLRKLISYNSENPNKIFKKVYKRIKKRYTGLPHDKKHLINNYINL